MCNEHVGQTRITKVLESGFTLQAHPHWFLGISGLDPGPVTVALE